MFCPRCGQSQVSDEVRFCKGCGFALSDVAEALTNNGLVNRNVVPVTRSLKKEVSKGLVVMTLSSIFFILSLIFGTPEPSYFVQFNMLVGLLCYLLGLVWIVFSFLRKSKDVPLYVDEKGRQLDFAGARQLDEQRQAAAPRLNEPDLSQLANAHLSRANNLQPEDLTGPPRSVAERTTELLKNDS